MDDLEKELSNDNYDKRNHIDFIELLKDYDEYPIFSKKAKNRYKEYWNALINSVFITGSYIFEIHDIENSDIDIVVEKSFFDEFIDPYKCNLFRNVNDDNVFDPEYGVGLLFRCETPMEIVLNTHLQCFKQIDFIILEDENFQKWKECTDLMYRLLQYNQEFENFFSIKENRISFFRCFCDDDI